MSDTKQPNQDKPSTPAGRPATKEVDLFPIFTEKKATSAINTTPGVTRLGTQISIFNPVTFEDALDIVECLRGRAATTISLDKMRKSDAGRLIDFVNGASSALDGDFHKLTETVYVFCPANISIVPPVQPPAPVKTGNTAFDFLFSPDLITSLEKPGSTRNQ